MSSDESDIELQSALPKKTNFKPPTSPSEDLPYQKQKKKKSPNQNSDPKKLTTKEMIHEALIDLKSRKGVSLYAIKKYLTERYNVDTEKNNYIIKKYMKKAVEEGTILQTKGIGASGSFKLVPVKEKKKPVKPKKIREVKEGEDNSNKPKKVKETSKKTLEEAVKTKTKQKEKEKVTKSNKTKEKVTKSKKSKEKVTKDKKIEKDVEKTKKIKIVKSMQTPSKKKATMIKRKSIGNIIRPPKMKPSAKA